MTGGKAAKRRIKTVVVGPLEVNCYILWGEEKEAVVIDPGADAGEIISELKKAGLKAGLIVQTHGHFDHVGAAAELRERTGAKLAIHTDDSTLMAEAHEHGVFFGVATPRQSPADVLLQDGQTLACGGVTLQVIHTPGHTRGGVCLYDEAAGLLFTGDTLFAGSVGRTDFEGGSMEALMRSIKERLVPLGDSVRVFPGHGPETTLGEEKETNPYLTGGF